MKELLLIFILLPGFLIAQDKFEIQVYDSKINDPMQFGLELHSNYTFVGRKTPEFSGEIPPATPAYSITPLVLYHKVSKRV